MSETGAAENTDREIWREKPGDFYSDSIHVTRDGGIGIDCGGYVIVKPLREWHRLVLRGASARVPQKHSFARVEHPRRAADRSGT